MAKYAMLNCWHDLNKGDLGIMLATVEEIRKQDPTAEIIGVSCFGRHDAYFCKNHEDLKRFVPTLYPAIFGIYGINFLGEYRKSFPFKIIAMLYEDIRYFSTMHMPIKIANRFLTKDERKTLEAIMSCDISFCKGGTIFMDYGSKRGKVALRRVCRFYDLLHRFSCEYYLFGQSFGPILQGKELKHTNTVIVNAKKVFLRETQCRELYPELKLNNANVEFSNDIAFLLDMKCPEVNPILADTRNVGITVRSYGDNINYKNSMVNTIGYLIEKGYHIHIFQQVAMDSEPDNNTAIGIIGSLSENYKKYVHHHLEHYMPQELKWMYGQMDLFIGTRLHSTIFSMAAGTVTIGLSYHGTKTVGVFENIGVGELVIQNPISFSKMKEKIIYVEENYEKLQSRIAQGVEMAKRQAAQAVRQMVNNL